MSLIDILIVVSVFAVLITLVLGVINMRRGDEASRLRSQKLMRARVILQGVAVVFLIIGMVLKANGNG